ncbi:MAG: queuosine precursor transporter [Archaeoglobi archaeon]|nr:queuosine precursor transporter [Archaeoglobi archaeon]
MIEVVFWIILVLSSVVVCSYIAREYGAEILIGVFASLTVLSNIIAFKLVTFGPFIVPSAVIAYSTTFLITDILSEFYGKKTALKAVHSAILANVLMVAIIFIALSWPPAPLMSSDALSSFNSVFSFAPRVIGASLIAFVVSQHHDVIAFHFWKKKTEGKHLWLRNNASTMVSQLLDTAIFITIAFYGLPSAVLLNMIFGQYLVKLLIAALDTPFIYLASFVMREKSSLEVIEA